MKKATCILLLFSTALFAVAAQIAPEKKPSTEQSASERAQQGNPLLQKVTSVLDQVLEARKTFADENLRVMIQAHVADMLWGYDEPRARQLFESILPAAERLADQGSTPPPSYSGTVYPVRTQVIRLIMFHDPDWATRLVESRGELAADLKSRSTARNRERTNLQLHLGTYFAQRDPRRAVLAVKPFADTGDFNSLMLVLGMIRFKDASAADELFIQALARARAGQPSFEDIRKFASYVFPSFGEGVLRFSADGSKRDPFAPSSSGPAAVERFLDFAFDFATRRLDAALTGASGARLDARSMLDFAVPKSLVPYFDRFLPDKAPLFRARLQEALSRVPAEERPYLVLTESGTAEQLLSRAGAIDDARLKDTLIQRAVYQASYGEDFERAAEIIEQLSTESGRSSARHTLRQRIDQKSSDEALRALNQGDFDTAEVLLSKLSDWRSDGLLVNSLVSRVAGKDKTRATQILNEYERRASNIEESSERALRLMQLAGFASNIDLDYGFEKMKRAIVEFNQAGFVPQLERYRDNVSGAGHANPAGGVNIGLSALLGNWDLRWMGRTDFDRAVALTRQVQMKEAAAVMLLNVCRGALLRVPAGTR